MSTAPKRQPLVGSLVLFLASVASGIALLRLQNIAEPGAIPWWIWPVTIVGFAVADATVVRVHFRSETTAFTFVELPLFLAAIYVAPFFVWISMTIGVAISVFAIQRLPKTKAMFNVANLSLQGAVGLSVFHTVLQGANPVGPSGWAAAAVAGLLSSAVGTAGVVLVLLMVQHWQGVEGIGQAVFMSALTAITNVSLALMAAVMIDYRPLTLVLLVVPIAALFGSYRAYTAERAQRDRVQAMHELALEVRSIRDHHGVGPALALTAEHLGATRAELVLFPDQRDSGHATRFSVEGDDVTTTEVVSADLAEVVDAVHGLASPERLASRQDGPAEIAGAIPGESRALGILRLTGRLRGGSNFTKDDLVMFEIVLEQLGLTFEKNQLGQAVSRLERRRRELQYEASHDVLTGLGNRAMLSDRLNQELACSRRPTLLYMDLDDFKNVNDRHGHDAGDQVLIEVARRFAAVVGPGDCVARLGGDEFAVLLSEYSDDIGIATALLAVAGEPIELPSGAVHVQASIGLARADKSVDAATLLKRADVAMYEAKASGKGKLTLASVVTSDLSV